MSVTIEALYIFTEQNQCVLEHVYNARPPTAQDLLVRLKSIPSPRPSILQLPDFSPQTTVFSILHAGLSVHCTSSKDAQALAVLEFLHRVVDVFEDFLGSPLLAEKIESNYEIVAQLLNEMCDGGIVSNTEANALRETVEVSSLLGKFFGQVGLPGSTQVLGQSNNLAATLKASSSLASGPAIPWRKSNVKHTSNELYVDIVESLSVIFAPSGRPISARVNGSILFTAKISGIPDLLLTLTAPGGTSLSKTSGVSRSMQLPIFHPCVRLARWKENPGKLSFIPPDGKFILAGYETDLLPSSLDREQPPSQPERIFLPAMVDMRTGLGTSGTDFEARLTLNNNFPGAPAPKPNINPRTGAPATSTPFSFGGSTSGNSSAPSLETLVVTIPFPSNVRTVTELKPTRGEANYIAQTKTVEWRVPTKDGTSINGTATLTGNISGSWSNSDDGQHDINAAAESAKSRALSGYYDEDTVEELEGYLGINGSGTIKTKEQKSQAAKIMMPRSIAVSFGVKGWVPSGIKVESLVVDVGKSKGLGDGVKPYKGVKYMTVSKRGVERRIS